MSITRICIQCGKEFTRRKYSSDHDKQIYCSLDCFHASKRLIRSGSDNGKWKPKIDIVCAYCGEHFETYPSRVGRRKYCCKDHKRLADLERIADGPRTNLEVAMARGLTKSGIAFAEQVIMFNNFMVDFKLSEHPLIIQCDGVFWHNREKAALHDQAQDQQLEEAGYDVLRFTDQELLDHIDDCLALVKQTIGHEHP